VQRATTPPPSRRRRTSAGERGPSRAGPLLGLFALAFAVRVAYAWLAVGPGATPSSDPAEYHAVAWNLARGAGFSLNASDGGPHPTAFVPPVVPWLVSLLYGIVGPDYFAAVLLQCAIGACVPLLTAALGASMFGASIGQVAAVLVAIDPLLVFFSGYLLTETTFTAALLAALAVTAEWVKTPRPGRAFGAGLLWGVAALTRPTALLLPLVVALWAWVPLGLTVAPRDRVRQVALLLAGLAIVVAPWAVRNTLVLGRFVPVKTGSGRALLDSNNEVVWGEPRLRGGAIGMYDREPWASQLRGLSETEVDDQATAMAWAFLAPRVSEWPAMAAAKLGRMWRLRGEAATTGTWQRSGSALDRVARSVDPFLPWFALTLPFAIWGWVRTLRGPRRWFQALPAIAVVYFSAITVVFWGALRMRVPVEPLVLLLAAAGIEDARRRLRVRVSGLRIVRGAGARRAAVDLPG